MVKWLKFIGLSFFSDKISKEAVKRGYLNIVLGVLFALVFLFCGVLAADMAPFSAHYNNSPDFTAFVRNAVGGLNLEVSSGKISSPRIVDTFSVSADAAAYAVNGYNLVVDTRSADAYDDFEAYYISNDGKGQEITPEEYATLSDVAKRNFEFKIRYTARELVLTDDLTAEHEKYLKDKGSESFAELSKKQGEMPRAEYRRQVYRLYVKEYYPDVEVNIQHAEGLADCKKILMLAKAGKIKGCLIEGMGCPGGCVAGVGTIIPPEKAKVLVEQFSKNSENQIPEAEWLEYAERLTNMK